MLAGTLRLGSCSSSSSLYRREKRHFVALLEHMSFGLIIHADCDQRRLLHRGKLREACKKFLLQLSDGAGVPERFRSLLTTGEILEIRIKMHCHGHGPRLIWNSGTQE